MYLVVVIERPDGSTYEQNIPYVRTVNHSLFLLKEKLGRGYWIVDWRFGDYEND